MATLVLGQRDSGFQILMLESAVQAIQRIGLKKTLKVDSRRDLDI